MASIITLKRDDNRSAGARAMTPGPNELLDDCLAGVELDDDGRAQAWRDYVSAVSAYGHDGSELTIEVAS